MEEFSEKQLEVLRKKKIQNIHLLIPLERALSFFARNSVCGVFGVVVESGIHSTLFWHRSQLDSMRGKVDQLIHEMDMGLKL